MEYLKLNFFFNDGYESIVCDLFLYLTSIMEIGFRILPNFKSQV